MEQVKALKRPQIDTFFANNIRLDFSNHMKLTFVHVAIFISFIFYCRSRGRTSESRSILLKNTFLKILRHVAFFEMTERKHEPTDDADPRQKILSSL